MTQVEADRGQSGFSLLETLVAVMVLGIALVVILQLYSEGLKAGDLSVGYTRALLCAQNEMENLLLRSSLEAGEIHTDIDDQFSSTATILRREPESDDGKQAFDLFDITVRVTWQERGVEKNIELSTVAIPDSNVS